MEQAMNRIEEDDDIQDYKKPWVGLTDEDVFAVIKKLQDMYHRPPIEIFARGIEQLLKDKNS
jgi:hypothetical protein